MRCEFDKCEHECVSILGACPEHWDSVEPAERERRYAELMECETMFDDDVPPDLTIVMDGTIDHLKIDAIEVSSDG